MQRLIFVTISCVIVCCVTVNSTGTEKPKKVDNIVETDNTVSDSSPQCSRDQTSGTFESAEAYLDQHQSTQCSIENEDVEAQVESTGRFENKAVDEMSESETEVAMRVLEELPELDELLEVEKQMLQYISVYIHNETNRLRTLSKNLLHWMEVSDYSMADPEEYLSVYLNCFHLLKRMALDVQTQLLNYSLYDEHFAEQDLNQWDHFSSDHLLTDFVQKSPVLVEHLSELDAHGILMVLNSNPDLQVPEIGELSNVLSDRLKAPLEFDGALTSREEINEALKSFIEHLKGKGIDTQGLVNASREIFPDMDIEDTAGVLFET